MKNIKILKTILAILPLVAALGLMPSVASAKTGFVVDSSKTIVGTGFGECLHTSRWKSDMGMCGDVAKKVMDSDGDGVPDDKDKCPGTPKGVKVNKDGCGIDSDGDGVADYEDACPGTPRGTPVDTRGCPKVSKITVGDVNFDFDRATLKDAAQSTLNAAADQIKTHSSAVKGVMVTGYTDSTGPEAYNQALSERRANAVKGYLEGKGISNITAEGRGEANPVGDNATREGRAANRRVEIDVKM
jgi:OOP family OmpA-OmpF porin